MGFFKKLKERLFTLNITDPSLRKPARKKVVKQVHRHTRLPAQKRHSKRVQNAPELDKYVAGLHKSGFSFAAKFKAIQSRHQTINEELFVELEELLIMTDVSARLVTQIINDTKKVVRLNRIEDPELIAEIIAEKMFISYAGKTVVDTRLNLTNPGLNIALITGVNGSGKTTSIAKMASLLKSDGKKVLIAAADTFRAGAVKQLSVWATRLAVSIVKPARSGSDPGAVVYEALAKAQAENYDVLLIDTAGRLQNKVNLMNELAKINKIIKRSNPVAPHETLLVLDATTGQNGLSQASSFAAVVPLTGIILTKMDGTSKGGIVLAIKEHLNLPVKLIGLGERVDDLQEFDLDAFIFGLTRELMSHG